MSNEEFHKLVLEKFDSMDTAFEKRFDKLEAKMDKRFDEVLDMVRNLEVSNGNRHIGIVNEIKELRSDLNTIEKVTAKNWKDISDLKEAK
ncbi:MAG: hypothetical protein JW924_04665 [Fusobacteriaceae bacterium]|nr:hypothetical protein [Fusobacteriaceae bacterium]